MPHTVVELQLPDDALAHVGIGVAAAEQDVTPALDLRAGDAIEVTFLHTLSWRDDRGLAITDAHGLVLAAEEGWGADLSVLTDGPLDGVLEVEDAGAWGPSQEHECGRIVGHMLRFDAGVPIEGPPNEEVTLPAGEGMLTARNAGAWDFLGDVGCTDTWGPTSWVVFR